MAYSHNEKMDALDLWFALEGAASVDGFVGELGHPSAGCMRGWIRAGPGRDPDKPRRRSKPVLAKLEAIRRVSEGRSLARAGAPAGVGAPTADCWAGRFAEGGARGAAAEAAGGGEGGGAAGGEKGAGRRPAPVTERAPDVPSELPDGPDAPKAAAVRGLQTGDALPREVPGVLKAGPGCDPADPTNAERARAAAAPGGRLPLAALRARMGVAKSACCYQPEATAGPGPDDGLADAVELGLPDDPRKACLSPVVDLFDGKPVAWRVGLRPDRWLAEGSLRDACGTLRPGEHPFRRTDGGRRCRHEAWKAACAEFGVRRSMSRKGRSPDNAACEGFFGRLKNEFFHGRDWRGVTAEEFMARLDAWMRFYSEGRLRVFREDGRRVHDTIDGRRRRLGLAA